MIRLFTSLWYYARLNYHIIQFYRVTKQKDIEENDINQFVHRVIPIIEKCGCVCTKFAQWVTPILDTLYNEIDQEPYWLKKLEKFYENCQDHSLDYTLERYNQDFKDDFHDKYTIEDHIGSGSIGQVYKIKDKYTKIDYAMKVLHPNVYFDMWFMKLIITLFLWIPYTRKMIYDILPVDIPKLTELFETQLDMIHEANNLSQMKYLHKDNSMIIIPDLIRCSSNILIMSYEDGITLDDSQQSEYEKYKCICLLSLFVRNSLEINNLIHGDIHKGNWKMKEDKLVIYDFGFCWSIPTNNKFLNENLFYSNEATDINDLSYLIEFICYTLDTHTDKVKQDIQDYCNNDSERDQIANGSKLFKMLCHVAKQNNIVINPPNILGIIMIIQTHKYWTKYSLNNVNEQFETSDNTFRNKYINSITICQTYNIFPELQTRLKDRLNEHQPDVNELFDIVDQNKDITDEVRSLLNFD